MRQWFRLLLLALALLSGAAEAQQLTVSAAASLTDAFKDLAPKFEARHPGVTVRLNFAASGVLLQQIRQGAPVDVFASADQETMDRAGSWIAPATRTNFATNALVLIEPVQGGHGLQRLQDLANPAIQRLAVGKTGSVPAGRYTQEALEAAGLWAPLAPKLVQADSVRQVLDYVSRGEAEAGFVYRSDAARMPDKVRIVLTASGHTPVSYPAAVVADSRHIALAKDFIAFLVSEPARRSLVHHGFGMP